MGAGHKSPLQKRPTAPCRPPPAFVNDVCHPQAQIIWQLAIN
ncbi:hypothetical protein VL20_5138 [Microcystis panniformis FACHB-1757]|uniref:Uncharacterized protein n=1 Tax=Microcystis panniformis FACHB-1757 TaxID=1638788 RepID=A0A0K1S7L9_9CHRO|nr:hypothetical protein VL20_5138 [Microcystis panniformis FACHB-1757]